MSVPYNLLFAKKREGYVPLSLPLRVEGCNLRAPTYLLAGHMGKHVQKLVVGDIPIAKRVTPKGGPFFLCVLRLKNYAFSYCTNIKLVIQ